MHNISSRRESFGEFHNLLDDLLKDEERFWRYFRMNAQKDSELSVAAVCKECFVCEVVCVCDSLYFSVQHGI